MSTVVFAGCTGGMGSLLFKQLNAVHSSGAAAQVLGQPIRHMILIDYFREPETQMKQLRASCHASIVRVDVLHWDAASDSGTIALLSELDKVISGLHIDMVIVTTGLGFHGELKRMTIADSSATLQRLIRVNAVGPSLLLQACALKMKQRSGHRPPCALVMSSFSGVVGLPHRAAYCASKFALNGYIESLSTEYPDVRFVLVCPTSVSTEFRENWKKQVPAASSSSGGTSEGGVAVNAAQLTAEECVLEVWRLLALPNAAGGVQIAILPRGKAELAYVGVRFPGIVGRWFRNKVVKASSKM